VYTDAPESKAKGKKPLQWRKESLVPKIHGKEKEIEAAKLQQGRGDVHAVESKEKVIEAGVFEAIIEAKGGPLSE